MNYLAHIHLSGPNDDILIGNFIADFIRNKDVVRLPESIKQGVLLHRHIDAFTDIHPLVRKVTKIFRPTQSKYAPVVSDIIFDYFLVRSWDQFSTVSLHEFKKTSYTRLLNNIDGLPPKASTKVEAMCQGNFISSYEDLEGLQYVFSRMEKRVSFPSKFQEAVRTLKENEDAIRELFLEFYPELQERCRNFINSF